MAPVCRGVCMWRLVAGVWGLGVGFGDGHGHGHGHGHGIRVGLRWRLWMGVCELAVCFRARFVIFLIKKRMSILLKFEWS